MISRLLGLIALAYALGFIAFAVALPGPAGADTTDAIVVLTGAEGRIDEALAVLNRHLAPRMLVAGVDPEVTAAQFAAHYRVPATQMQCCITLGYESVDTRSNALEAAGWVAETRVRSLRLVTSDWHMRRAAWEMRHALPKGTVVIDDAVPTQPSFNILFVEYNKLLARHLARLWRG